MGFWFDFFKDKRFSLDFKIANFIMNDSLRNYLVVDSMKLNDMLQATNLTERQKKSLNKIAKDIRILMNKNSN